MVRPLSALVRIQHLRTPMRGCCDGRCGPSEDAVEDTTSHRRTLGKTLIVMMCKRDKDEIEDALIGDQ